MSPLQRLLILPMAAMLNCFVPPVRAAHIWTGPPTVFAKAAFADPDSPAAQDRITGDVWLTRGDIQGIYNVRREAAYDSDISPAGTEWAFGTTSDLPALTFGVWRETIASNPPASVGQEMVVHLISDDIYIDITFLSWQPGLGQGLPSGGAFSYERATASAAGPGDFNGDAVIDAEDYTLWRDNLGRPEAALHGGGDGSGVVDAGDYSLWTEQYGADLAGSATPAPDPGALSLFVTGALFAPIPRRQLRRP